MTKKNEWQSIADDIEIEIKSDTENKDTENKDIEKENKDDKTEYIWDKI